LASGDCFRRVELEKARLRLLQTGLFAAVDITSVPPEDGRVPLRVTLKERNHRTVKAGAGYNMDEGPGLSSGWEHRNFFGSAQKLSVNARFSRLFKSLNTTLNVPSFRSPAQSLDLGAEIADENLDTFDAFGVT